MTETDFTLSVIASWIANKIDVYFKNKPQYIEELGAAKGCKRVTLLSDGDNFKAHKFYEKQGFVKSAMIPFRKVIDR